MRTSHTRPLDQFSIATADQSPSPTLSTSEVSRTDARASLTQRSLKKNRNERGDKRREEEVDVPLTIIRSPSSKPRKVSYLIVDVRAPSPSSSLSSGSHCLIRKRLTSPVMKVGAREVQRIRASRASSAPRSTFLICAAILLANLHSERVPRCDANMLYVQSAAMEAVVPPGRRRRHTRLSRRSGRDLKQHGHDQRISQV